MFFMDSVPIGILISISTEDHIDTYQITTMKGPRRKNICDENVPGQSSITRCFLFGHIFKGIIEACLISVQSQQNQNQM